MPRKRLASEVDTSAQRPQREHAKRTKVSLPDIDDRSDSSIPSSCSVSEASAMQSSPEISKLASKSSVSSLGSARDVDSDSSVSSSSEESSDEESEDESITTVGGPKKPAIQNITIASGAQDLQTRLSALLPQLAAANDELGQLGGDYSIEDVEEDDQHIEMDLGLGVLEERGQDDHSSSEEDSEKSDSDEMLASSGAVKRVTQDRDTHVMANLTGRRVDRQRAGIEDLE